MKICPLISFQDGKPQLCQEHDCAWWDDIRKMCCAMSLCASAKWLEEISDYLPKLVD